MQKLPRGFVGWLRRVQDIRSHAGALLNLIRRPRQRLRLLVATKLDSEFQVVAEFFSESKEIRAPNLPGLAPQSERFFPALRAHQFRKARVVANRSCSSVLYRSQFIVPPSSLEGPWKLNFSGRGTGGVLLQRGNHLLVNIGPRKPRIRNGIFVGTWSPKNWYHWLLDILPAVWMASFLPDEFSDYPVLLPADIANRPSWIEPLELVLGEREVVFLSQDSYRQVEDLVWIDSPTSPGPIPVFEDGNPRYSMQKDALVAFRKHIIEKVGVEETSRLSDRRVYLARANGSNRPDNQDELISIASDYGYEPTFFEQLSLKQTIETMIEAKHIVGPHGAGWANAIFCPTETQAFMWTWKASIHDNWFANVARCREMSFDCSAEVEIRDGRWQLSTQILEDYLGTVHP